MARHSSTSASPRLRAAMTVAATTPAWGARPRAPTRTLGTGTPRSRTKESPRMARAARLPLRVSIAAGTPGETLDIEAIEKDLLNVESGIDHEAKAAKKKTKSRTLAAAANVFSLVKDDTVRPAALPKTNEKLAKKMAETSKLAKSRHRRASLQRAVRMVKVGNTMNRQDNKVSIVIKGPGSIGLCFDEASHKTPPLRVSAVVRDTLVFEFADRLYEGILMHEIREGDGSDQCMSPRSPRAKNHIIPASQLTQPQLAKVLRTMERPYTLVFVKGRDFKKDNTRSGVLPVVSQLDTESMRILTLDKVIRGMQLWAAMGGEARVVGNHMKKKNVNVDFSSGVTALKMMSRAQKKDVKRLELLRKETFNSWRALLRWKGTVLPNVFSSKLFLFSFFIYFGTTALIHYDIPMPDVGDVNKYLGPVTAFLMFFSVFYNNQCYVRWAKQIDAVTSCKTCIVAVSTLLCAATPDDDSESVESVIAIMGYLNAAQIATFTGLTSGYNVFFFKIMVYRYRLLTREELINIMKLDPGSPAGNAYRRIILMAMKRMMALVKRAAKKGRPMIAFIPAQNTILQLQEHLAGLFYADQQPIPFGYYNMLSWLLFFYVPMSSFMVALENYERWYLSWIPVFFVNVCLLGLEALARKFSTPFGDEIECVAVNAHLDSTCRASRKLLPRGYSMNSSDEEEDELEQRTNGSPSQQKDGQGHRTRRRDDDGSSEDDDDGGDDGGGDMDE